MARGNFKFIYLGFLGASNITSEGFYVAGILDGAQKKENESGPVVLRELFRVMERQFFINEKFSVSDMADFTFSYRKMVLTKLFKNVYLQVSGNLNEGGGRKRLLYIINIYVFPIYHRIWIGGYANRRRLFVQVGSADGFP